MFRKVRHTDLRLIFMTVSCPFLGGVSHVLISWWWLFLWLDGAGTRGACGQEAKNLAI